MTARAHVAFLLVAVSAGWQGLHGCVGSPSQLGSVDAGGVDAGGSEVALVDAGACMDDAGKVLRVNDMVFGVCGSQCTCLPDGTFRCSHRAEEWMACTPRPCKYDTRTYVPFASFPASDGCNTCKCEVLDLEGRVYERQRDLDYSRPYHSRVTCTNLRCVDGGPDAAGADAESDATGDAADGGP